MPQLLRVTSLLLSQKSPGQSFFVALKTPDERDRERGEVQNKERSKPDTVQVNTHVSTLKMSKDGEWIYVTDKIRDQMKIAGDFLIQTP